MTNSIDYSSLPKKSNFEDEDIVAVSLATTEVDRSATYADFFNKGSEVGQTAVIGDYGVGGKASSPFDYGFNQISSITRSGLYELPVTFSGLPQFGANGTALLMRSYSSPTDVTDFLFYSNPKRMFFGRNGSFQAVLEAEKNLSDVSTPSATVAELGLGNMENIGLTDEVKDERLYLTQAGASSFNTYIQNSKTTLSNFLTVDNYTSLDSFETRENLSVFDEPLFFEDSNSFNLFALTSLQKDKARVNLGYQNNLINGGLSDLFEFSGTYQDSSYASQKAVTDLRNKVDDAETVLTGDFLKKSLNFSEITADVDKAEARRNLGYTLYGTDPYPTTNYAPLDLMRVVSEGIDAVDIDTTQFARYDQQLGDISPTNLLFWQSDLGISSNLLSLQAHDEWATANPNDILKNSSTLFQDLNTETIGQKTVFSSSFATFDNFNDVALYSNPSAFVSAVGIPAKTETVTIKSDYSDFYDKYIRQAGQETPNLSNLIGFQESFAGREKSIYPTAFSASPSDAFEGVDKSTIDFLTLYNTASENNVVRTQAYPMTKTETLRGYSGLCGTTTMEFGFNERIPIFGTNYYYTTLRNKLAYSQDRDSNRRMKLATNHFFNGNFSGARLSGTQNGSLSAGSSIVGENIVDSVITRKYLRHWFVEMFRKIFILKLIAVTAAQNESTLFEGSTEVNSPVPANVTEYIERLTKRPNQTETQRDANNSVIKALVDYVNDEALWSQLKGN